MNKKMVDINKIKELKNILTKEIAEFKYFEKMMDCKKELLKLIESNLVDLENNVYDNFQEFNDKLKYLIEQINLADQEIIDILDKRNVDVKKPIIQ